MMGLDTDYQPVFESLFFECFGHDVEVMDYSITASGIVSTGARVTTSEGVFFVKINQNPDGAFFQQEAENLQFLKTWLYTPEVVGFGKNQGHNYLVLSLVEDSPPTPEAWKAAGRAIASLHSQTSPQFGYTTSNYLVDLPQDNRWKADGIDFMIQNRILPLMGYCLMEEKIPVDLYKRIEALCARMGRIIPDEKPALLHGDLWKGNLLFGKDRQPVWIDPAVYYGFREHELAFTHLFGGFDASFYEDYLEIFPLEPGFGERVSMYHIHPLLVHVYYFGSSYVVGLERIVKRFS